MESWAPIVGMTMVSIGSVIILAAIGGLFYYNWPRPNRSDKANPVNSAAAELDRDGEIQP